MKQIKWNENWKFWSDGDAFALVWDVPEQAKTVTLPHDAMIEKAAYAESPNRSNTGYRDGGNYTYVKHLDLGDKDLGRKYILKFDGVYCHALVYVNEQLAGSEANGYSTFYVNLTPYLRQGRNEVRVQVKNAGMTNSRWYSGSGIYRDAYLLTSGPVYLEPDCVQVTTESADRDYAVLTVRSTVINETLTAKTLRLCTVIRNQALAGAGTACASCGAAGGSEEGCDAAGEEASSFFLMAGESKTLTQRILVKKPALWSAEEPELYTVKSCLCDGDRQVDEACASFGIRTLALDAARGLRVNGKSVKLRGACIHHDSGILGAATYADSQLRQIRLLKEAGFNAVRISHHPAAPALLDACDRVGMYVMDEFSDMWQRTKNDLDYALDFDKWWQTDIDLMVRKDYNHPSVILYSVGNEIPEIGTDAGSETCAHIAGRLKALDPTRFTTAGINGVFAAGDQVGRIMADVLRGEEPGDGRVDGQENSGQEAAGQEAPGQKDSGDGNVNDFMTVMDTKMDQIVVHPAISERLEKACASLDIAGYNYMTARYEPDTAAYPNRVMVGSETYPPEIARNWKLVEALPSVIGDFTWTGWDYIGEAGVGVPAYAFGEGGFGAQFPCQLAYCGDIDLTGFRRPMSYYREIVFGLRTQPYLAVQDPAHYGEKLIKTPWVMSDAKSAWDYEGYEGKPVVVEVYAPGDEAELFRNGESLGRKPLDQCRALFETVYEPGKLTAVAYRDGETLGEYSLESPSGQSRIRLTCDYNGEELIYLSAEITDQTGRRITGRDGLLTVSVTGAELLGTGSGDPRPLFNYNEGKTKTWNGRAQIILKKGKEPSEILVTVSAESAGSASIRV